MGKRGPVPQGKHLKAMSGSLPLTKENAALKDVEPPDAPKCLSAAERKIWNLTVDILRPTLVLNKEDYAILEAYCCSYVRWHDADFEIRKAMKRNKKLGLLAVGANGGFVINPLVNIARRYQADTVLYAQQLGMTPASRMRLDLEASSAAKQKVNTFEKLKKIRNERMGKKSGKVREGIDPEEECS